MPTGIPEFRLPDGTEAGELLHPLQGLVPLREQLRKAVALLRETLELPEVADDLLAEALLVPIIPTTLSLRTLDQLLDFRAKSPVQDLEILPFFSMVDRRRGLQRRMVEELCAERPEMLGSTIPYASDLAQMGLHRRISWSIGGTRGVP